jgi:hypothetical protein
MKNLSADADYRMLITPIPAFGGFGVSVLAWRLSCLRETDFQLGAVEDAFALMATRHERQSFHQRGSVNQGVGRGIWTARGAYFPYEPKLFQYIDPCWKDCLTLFFHTNLTVNQSTMTAPFNLTASNRLLDLSKFATKIEVETSL